MHNSEQAWTVVRLADETKFHINTIRRWVREGTIPAIKYGRQWLIPADVAAAVIEGRQLPKPN